MVNSHVVDFVIEYFGVNNGYGMKCIGACIVVWHTLYCGMECIMVGGMHCGCMHYGLKNALWLHALWYVELCLEVCLNCGNLWI